MQATCSREAEYCLLWLLFLAGAGKERHAAYSSRGEMNTEDARSDVQCLDQFFMDCYFNSRRCGSSSSGGGEKEGGGEGGGGTASPPENPPAPTP